MLDALWTAILVGCAPVAIGLILHALPATGRQRIAIAIVLTAWFALTTATRIRGIDPVPGAAFSIFVPVLAGTALMVATSGGRALVAGLSLAPIVALHITRFAGGGFLLLHDAGRLSDPFAFYAGWGDVLTAAAAIPTALVVARRREGWRTWLLAWNLLGFADFCSAIFFGVTSQPGSPLRLFFEPPGASVLIELPWRFIPSYFVPLFLLTHVALFLRLAGVASGPPSDLPGSTRSVLP